MRTKTVDRSEIELPLSFECETCENYNFRIGSKGISSPPWECNTCGELYIPCPETVRNPTEITIRLMRGHTKSSMKCSDCGEEFRRTVLEKNLKKLIKQEDSDTAQHLLYQITRVQELAYWNCPECGEPQDFQRNNRPRRGGF